MFALFILVFLALAAFAGGLIALFAGRRFYGLWLGLAVFFFVTRLLDLALFRLPDAGRDLGTLVLAFLIVGLVVAFRQRIVRFVPPVGGFIVAALVAERLLALLAPEAGKYTFLAVLFLGGLFGLFLFRRLLDFDDAVIVLSAVWGAGLLSRSVFDVLDLFLITAAGLVERPLAGFLAESQVLETLVWLGLAALGIVVQKKAAAFRPLPEPQARPRAEAPAGGTTDRRRRLTAVAAGSLVVVLLLAAIVGATPRFSRSIRSALSNLERSLGVEVAAPGDAPWEWAVEYLRPQLELQPDDRLLVLVPHPDDDILSTAGTVLQALELGLPVRVVFLTNGDYNETSFALYRKEITLDSVEALRLGETRREEALTAQGHLGVTPDRITFLGYPDGGTLEIFERHWGATEPYRALLSGQSAVPYTFTQSPGAPFRGESILQDLEQILRDFRPTKIFTSHPGDVHPDHQSLPLYLQVALWDLQGEFDPQVYHFITHYGRWPQPRGYQPEHPLTPPAQFDAGNRWQIVPLSPDQRQVKLEALQAHKTQWGSGQAYLESVVRANELFDVLGEVPLGPGQVVEVLPTEAGIPGEALALHPDDHQEAYVDTQIRTVRREGDELVFEIHFEQPLETDVGARIWAVGYRSGTPFGEMPKLFLDLGVDGNRLSDRGQPLAPALVAVVVSPTSAEVRVPLAVLGDPERVMVSGRTQLGGVPLDNIPWVFLNLNPPAAP